MEETKIREMRQTARRGTIKYEDAARAPKKKLVEECLKELDRRRNGKESNWEKKRRRGREKPELEREEADRMREAGVGG